MFEQNRAWLEALAQQVAGRQVTVVERPGRGRGSAAAADAGPPPTAGRAPPRQHGCRSRTGKTALNEQALADAGVQAMLEVFPAEIRDVEEM